MTSAYETRASSLRRSFESSSFHGRTSSAGIDAPLLQVATDDAVALRVVEVRVVRVEQADGAVLRATLALEDELQPHAVDRVAREIDAVLPEQPAHAEHGEARLHLDGHALHVAARGLGHDAHDGHVL